MLHYKERQRNVEWVEYYMMRLGSRIDKIRCSNCGFDANKSTLVVLYVALI